MAEDAGKLLVDGVMNVAAANAALGEASLTEAIEETQKKLDFGELKTWLDPDYYEPLQRAAERLAKTSWVPPEFRDKPEDCFVLCDMALQLKMKPSTLARYVYVHQGRPGFPAQFAIAMAERAGVFKGAIRYETGKDESRGAWCTAHATLAKNGENIEGPPISIAMAKAEGWWHERLDKNNRKFCKWLTMPGVMLRYRAAMFLIRLHVPWVLMGLHQSVEELQEISDVENFASGPTPMRQDNVTPIFTAKPPQQPPPPAPSTEDSGERSTDDGFHVEQTEQAQEAPATQVDEKQAEQSNTSDTDGARITLDEFIAKYPDSEGDLANLPADAWCEESWDHGLWYSESVDSYLDIRGIKYNPNSHGTKNNGLPSMLRSGMFRQKRNVGKKGYVEPADSPVEEAQSTLPLDREEPEKPFSDAAIDNMLEQIKRVVDSAGWEQMSAHMRRVPNARFAEVNEAMTKAAERLAMAEQEQGQ